MPYFAHTRLEAGTEKNLPPFPSKTSVKDDLAHIHLTRSASQPHTSTPSPGSRSRSPSPALDDHSLNLHTAAQRRAHFHDAAHRKQLAFGPQVRIFLYCIVKFSSPYSPHSQSISISTTGPAHHRLRLRVPLLLPLPRPRPAPHRWRAFF